MDKKEFGLKVRGFREEIGITREELCGDETELSVRQLARIEAGQSLPTLKTAAHIAQILGISIARLTDVEELTPPKRYQELKYLIVRTTTYGEAQRIKEREAYFKEVFSDYYDMLPEEEKIVIDCLQSRWDVHLSNDANYGFDILTDYFDQVKKKETYTFNDLVIIDLYLLCISVDLDNGDAYDETTYIMLMERLLKKQDNIFSDDLYVLNNVLLNHFSLAFRLNRKDYIEAILQKSNEIMTKIQDFQKMPILHLIKWKYALLYQKDKHLAKNNFDKAILFSRLINDSYLEEKLLEEWDNDTT